MERWCPGVPTTDEPWLLVSDGGLRGHQAGIGVVLAQGMEVRKVAGYGLCVHARDSKVMEWIAKGMVLFLSSGLAGRKMLGADSAAGAFTGQRLPHFGTWVDDLARKALHTVDLESYRECWMEAQHDSGAKTFLVHCNLLADEAATESLLKAQPHDFFLPQEYVDGPVFHVNGKVVVNLSAIIDQIYDDMLQQKVNHGLEGWDGRWTPHDQVSALKNGSLSTEILRRLMLLRVLGTQQEREGTGLQCMWCERSDSLRASHLRRHRPVFYARWVRITALLAQSFERQCSAVVQQRSDLEVQMRHRSTTVWLAVISDGELGDYLEKRSGSHVVLYSWSGRFFTTGPWKTDWNGSPVQLDILFRVG